MALPTDINPFVQFASASASADLGYTIDQSLRWRTNANQFELDGTQPSAVGNDWTVSFWIKLSCSSVNDMIWSTDQNGTYSYFSWQASSGKFAYSSGSNLGNGAYRDPSAWYHIVMTPENAWVNGVLDYSGTIMPSVATNTGGQQISYWSSGWTGSHYLADFYFIQGQNLQPTTFGNFNANGVWVPKDPGFKTGLDASYTQYLTTPGYSWNPVYGTDAPVEAFDGGTSEYVNPLSSNDSITFAPADPLPFGHQLRVFMCHYADSSYTLNGNAVDTSGMSVGVCGWQTVATGSGTLENFTMNGSSSGTWLYAFELDGQILKEGKSYSNWSRYLTTDDTNGFYPTYPAWKSFNGSSADYSVPYTATNKLFFNPTNPIPYSQSLRIYCCKYADQQMLLNGVSISAAVGDGTCDWNVDITGSGTLESFELGNSTVGGAYLYAIEIDGKILTDGVNSDYGANGFHLTFDDPLDVGKDYSGNGNHFTTAGFDTTSYVSGYWVDNDSAATSGEVPNSQGDPYWTDINPSNADLDYSAAGGLNLAFDGNLSTYVYWVGFGEYSVGNVESATFDLRDYTDLQSLELLTASGAPNTNHTYTIELLDASKNPIAGTQAKTSVAAFASPEWVSVPISGTPRYMRLSSVPYTTDGIYKRMYWFGIRINGQILSQSATTAPTYDFMEDTPTTNYATWNPNIVSVYQSPNYSYANLATKDANGTAGAASLTTIQPPQSGKYYYETYWITKNTSSSWANLGFMKFNKANSSLTTNSTAAERFYIQPNSQTISNFGDTSQNTGWTLQNVNDVVGWQWDIDNNQVTITKNGADPVTVTFNTTDRIVPAIWSALSHATTGLNVGQQPFRYTPPAGFKDLNTANLETDPILDGRDHFRAITGHGNGGLPTPASETVVRVELPAPADGTLEEIAITGQSSASPRLYGIELNGTLLVQTGTELSGNNQLQSSTTAFSSATYPTSWSTYTGDVGAIANAFNGVIVPPATNSYCQSGTFWSRWRPTTARTGVTSIVIYVSYAGGGTGAWVNQVNVNPIGLLDTARTTFPSGLWWIKDRANSNQHQFVDSVRGGNLALTCPTVAAEAAYTAPAGDSVAWCWNYNAANPSQNGFDIVTYTGTGVARTVNHSLGSVPEFMIVKNRDNAGPNSQFCIYHTSVGATQTAYLNASSAFFADSNMWANTEPTTTQFTVGTNQAVNNNSQNIVAYLWTAIPGYSDFGSYTGNANADGPFVYLGFRPAFVMIKSSNSTYQWMIVDSTRNVANPVNSYLFPNLTNAEQSASTFDLDFLSNGFKLRSASATDNNASSITYIYAAFAENPFGGENQPPATAR